MGKTKRKHTSRRRSSSSSSGDEERALDDRIRSVIVQIKRKKLMELEAHLDDLPSANVSGLSSVAGEEDLNWNNENHHVDESIPPSIPPSALGDDVLCLLGEVDEDNEKLSEAIHSDLAVRWEVILKQGLASGCRSDLINKYPLATNCPLLAAPTLNPELLSCTQEATIQRDNRLKMLQTQMEAGMSAIGMVLDLLLNKEEKGEEDLRIIEKLSDAGRLFADIHHIQTLARRALILQNLKNKTTKEVLTNLPRDKWLFGEDLSEKIKAAKTLERTGLELKTAPQAAAASMSRRTGPSKMFLNSKSPSQRYQATRPGGQRKTFQGKQPYRKSPPRPHHRPYNNKTRSNRYTDNKRQH